MPGFVYDDPCDRPYGPGNPDYEHDGREDAARKAAELSIQDAFMEGQRAGGMSLAAGLNPHQLVSPEYDAWERGRSGALAMRAARMVA